MEFAQNVVLNVLTSGTAIGVYGTLVAMGIIALVKKYMTDKQAQKAFEIALMVADEVEDTTKEETRADNFLDKFIERMEEEAGRVPKKKEIEQAKAMKRNKAGTGN